MKKAIGPKRAGPVAAPAASDFRSDKDDAPARPVDISLDTSRRPMAGVDIVTYMERHRLERVQVVEALAMASPGTYAKLVKLHDQEVPFQIELLLRLYQKQPVRQRKLLPIDVFNAIYGELLAKFEATESYEAAKIMLYERFAGMLGRTVYSAYRWFKRNDNNNFGVANGPLRRLFSQLPEEPEAMRKEMENLARAAFRVRGNDFDTMCPLPDPKNPPVARRPGPLPGMRARRDEQLAQQVAEEVRSTRSVAAGAAVKAPRSGAAAKSARTVRRVKKDATPAAVGMKRAAAHDAGAKRRSQKT